MSDEEIRREYRLAKDPKKQLKILADENACSVSTIRSIVSADQLRGFVPIQELVEKEKEKEKEMSVYDPAPTTLTADPEWPPLPSAPPQAAADFDELGPSSLPDVQDIPEASAGAGTEDGSAPHQSAPPTASPRGSREDAAAENADLRGIARNLADGGWTPTAQQPQVTAPAAAGESGNIYRISGKDLSRMWHILGRLQGVLEASAEAGKPGEVMKDACDELEVLLMSLGENDPF